MENVIWIASITIQLTFYDPGQMGIHFLHECPVTSQQLPHLNDNEWSDPHPVLRTKQWKKTMIFKSLWMPWKKTWINLRLHTFITSFQIPVWIIYIYLKALVFSLPTFFFLLNVFESRKCLLWLPGPTYTSTHITPRHSLAPTQCVALWSK